MLACNASSHATVQCIVLMFAVPGYLKEISESDGFGVTNLL